MQPTNVRVYASFRTGEDAPVICWSEDGEPLVIDPTSARLVTAESVDVLYRLHADEPEWNVVPLPAGVTCWAGFVSGENWWWDRVVGFAGRGGSILFTPLTVVAPEAYAEVAGEGDTPNATELVWDDEMPDRKPTQ